MPPVADTATSCAKELVLTVRSVENKLLARMSPTSLSKTVWRDSTRHPTSEEVTDVQADKPSAIAMPAIPMGSGLIDRFFGVSEKGSTIRREILGGVSTFLALSYIFVVNPSILSKAGIDPSVSLFATIVISAAATLVMGLWARLPFVVSTGMEMNAYVAFFAVGALGFAWQQALGMVFWSGLLMLLLTAARIREQIIDSIPESLKVGLSFSVGIFLVLIALSISGVLVYQGLTLKSVGSLATSSVAALVFGAVSVFALQALKVPGAVLLSILVTAALYHLLGWATPPEAPPAVSSAMFAGIFAFDLSVILDPRAISVILVLFVLDFYGSVAKFIGLTLKTNIQVNGKLPRRTQALIVDGAGTCAASALGTTSVITFVESAVGIGAGARTGLAAVTCGILMLCCFFAIPVIQYIPLAATTGVLVYVGYRLCPSLEQLRGFSMTERIALLSMPIVTIATFAVDKAMLVGFAIFVVATLLSTRRVNLYLLGSTLLLALGVGLQLAL